MVTTPRPMLTFRSGVAAQRSRARFCERRSRYRPGSRRWSEPAVAHRPHQERRLSRDRPSTVPGGEAQDAHDRPIRERAKSPRLSSGRESSVRPPSGAAAVGVGVVHNGRGPSTAGRSAVPGRLRARRLDAYDRGAAPRMGRWGGDRPLLAALVVCFSATAPVTAIAAGPAASASIRAGRASRPARVRCTERGRSAGSRAAYSWPLSPAPAVLSRSWPPTTRSGRDIGGRSRRTPGQAVIAARAGVVVFAGPVAGVALLVEHEDGFAHDLRSAAAGGRVGAAVGAARCWERWSPGTAAARRRACTGGAAGPLDYLDPLCCATRRVRLLPVPDHGPCRTRSPAASSFEAAA